MPSEQELCYYIRNEQRSVQYVIGEDGTVGNCYFYDAFGVSEKAEETYDNRLHYNGQIYDELTEQYYLRARYYQPQVGRFTPEDLLFADGLNLYAYCGNNPVMYSDPSGLTEETSCGTKSQVENGNNTDVSGSFVDMMTPEEAKRYNNYWSQGTGSYQGVKVDGKWEKVIVDGKNINTRQRIYTTPRTRSITDVKLGSNGEMYYRETVFDEYGRKIGHNDYTDHGRPDITSHTNPHYHPNTVSNPSQHGGVPGLHPETPR